MPCPLPPAPLLISSQFGRGSLILAPPTLQKHRFWPFCQLLECFRVLSTLLSDQSRDSFILLAGHPDPAASLRVILEFPSLSKGHPRPCWGPHVLINMATSFSPPQVPFPCPYPSFFLPPAGNLGNDLTGLCLSFHSCNTRITTVPTSPCLNCLEKQQHLVAARWRVHLGLSLPGPKGTTASAQDTWSFAEEEPWRPRSEAQT